MRPEPQNQVDPKAKTCWRISSGLGCLLIGVVLACIAFPLYALVFYSSWILWLNLFIFLVFVVVLVVIAPNIRYRCLRYEVTDDEVDIRRGWIVIRRSITPLIRVQHVDTRKGPILRMLGLANVQVFTAADSLEIPCLNEEEADHLRDKVAELARIAQEDV